MNHVNIVCVVATCFFFALPSTCMDLAYVNNSVGTPTVLRCIELIDESGIFDDDQEIVRRIAYVESRDGATFTQGTGGIWKVSNTVLNNLIIGMNTSSFYPSIETHFNIQWENVTYEDLDIPIYSALTVRLVLASYEMAGGPSIPATVDAQYEIWNFVFQEDSNTLTRDEFRDIVNSIPIVPLCPSVYRDIIFVIDNSATVVPDPTFEPIKAFLMDVVDHFRISSTHTRVGIIQYGSEPQVSLILSQGVSTSSINTTIAGLYTVKTSIVFTGLALGRAISLFDPNQGGRSADSGVARIIVIITHSNTSDNLTSQIENAAAESIGIIAIGVTADVSRDELQTLASGNETTHVFQVDSYSSLSSIASDVEDRICEEQVLASGDRRISGSLEPGETVSFTITIPPEGKDFSLSTSEGTVSNYFSATTTTPSTTNNDFRLDVTVPDTTVTHSYQPASGGTTSLIFRVDAKDLRETRANTILYSRLQATSATTAVYSFVIGNPTETTTVSNVSIITATEARQLSDGEIAGIVFACLIFIAGIVIAIFYYWFCRISPSASSKEALFIPSAISKTDEIQLATSGEVVPDYENTHEIPIKESSPAVAAFPVIRPKTSFRGRSSQSIENEIRNNLRMAIGNNDVTATSAALEEFRNHNLVDVDGDLYRGEQLIAMHECLQGLNYAISKRNIDLLEKAIFVAKRRNFQTELKADVEKAEALLLDLKKLEELMSRLNQAIKADDRKLIEDITLQITAMNRFDPATIEKMMEIYRCKEELNSAVAIRDVDRARDGLENIRTKGFEPDLKPEVKRAEKMIQELEYLEKARTKILSLSQAQVGEIRSYASPPHGVHEVMQAVYYILGYSWKEIEKWKEIRALMGRTDKERLKAQILNIDQRKVKLSQVKLAKAEIESFDAKSISEISMALGLFYDFASSVIKEVEKLNPEASPFSPNFSDLDSANPR